MIGLVLAAPRSGSGKTTLAVALLALLQRRGLHPCAFKCGPDYIDPGFHRAVLGVECRNLDLYLSEPETVKALFARGCCGCGAVVAEGAMGYYDGVGGTPRASAWQVGQTLGLPALLVVSPRQLESLPGLLAQHTPHGAAAVLLNRCPAGAAAALVQKVQALCGLPVVGWLPEMPEAEFPARHLGLCMAGELPGLAARAQVLAERLEQNFDWPLFARLFAVPAPAAPGPGAPPMRRVRLAVAADEAFCFCYRETLEAFAEAGLEPVFFSPMADAALPKQIGGLYLPGGYPELHAEALSRNAALRDAIRSTVAAGLPTVAECGGFLYLGQSLQDVQGRVWPMAGALPGRGFQTPKLVRFGYAALSPMQNSMLFRQGETVPIHEFHHWDSTHNGTALCAEKPVSGKSWRCGFVSESLYAGFPHLYFAGRPQLARRFARAAIQWREQEP
ncbi:MAG: cobyrinate a,c-diamide synthase [Subdoligranulum sp.]|nr:cobyrinate a,c-diamide synthase [Subdoligranulum sp.]